MREKKTLFKYETQNKWTGTSKGFTLIETVGRDRYYCILAAMLLPVLARPSPGASHPMR